jgi:hypothetical protein
MTFSSKPFDPDEVRSKVAARNALRSEANLPLLSAEDEVRKACAHHADVQFYERFMQTPLRKRVDAKMLARLRRRYGEDFTPRGMLSGGGLRHHAMVENLMRKLYERFYGRRR